LPDLSLYEAPGPVWYPTKTGSVEEIEWLLNLTGARKFSLAIATKTLRGYDGFAFT
jgi:hypothetical protein